MAKVHNFKFVEIWIVGRTKKNLFFKDTKIDTQLLALESFLI